MTSQFKHPTFTSSLFTRVAIPGVLAVTLISSAQANLSYNSANADLILGFRSATNSYELNIGSASQFDSSLQTPGLFADGNVHLLSIGNINTDLSSSDLFNSANWYTANTGLFSIAGAQNGAGAFTDRTLFMTQAQATPGVQSTPLTQAGTSPQQIVRGKVVAQGGQYAAGTQGDGDLANNNQRISINNPNGLFQANSGSNSYRSYQPGGTTPNSGSAGNQAYAQYTGGIEGTVGQVLDLYRLNPVAGSPGTYLGSFALDSSGRLFFSSDINDSATLDLAHAVPEPGSALLVLTGSVGLFGFQRRRKS